MSLPQPRPDADTHLRDLLTTHYEVLADATDATLDPAIRLVAATRLPAISAQLFAALQQRHGSDLMTAQLTGHRHQLYRDPPAAYLRRQRPYARDLRQHDLLWGWVDGQGVRWCDPAEVVTAVFGSATDYVTVRTSVGRVLILDSWTLTVIEPRGTLPAAARPQALTPVDLDTEPGITP